MAFIKIKQDTQRLLYTIKAATSMRHYEAVAAALKTCRDAQPARRPGGRVTTLRLPDSLADEIKREAEAHGMDIYIYIDAVLMCLARQLTLTA